MCTVTLNSEDMASNLTQELHAPLAKWRNSLCESDDNQSISTDVSPMSYSGDIDSDNGMKDENPGVGFSPDPQKPSAPPQATENPPQPEFSAEYVYQIGNSGIHVICSHQKNFIPPFHMVCC